MSPAGMQPLGSERHGRSPKGRSAGALRSIEPLLLHYRQVGQPSGIPYYVPAGIRPAGAATDRRSPGGVSSRARANQSNLRTELPLSWTTLWRVVLCPRRESNPHLRFRKPLFFPLNYGDKDLEGIDELNGDGQAAIAVHGDFSRAGFALDYRQLSRDYISFAYAPLEH